MSSAAATAENRWPGERLGLPESGPRSVGRLGRRIVALVIDWGVAYLLSWVFFPTPQGTEPIITLGIFAVLQILFLLVVNGSLGHVVVRLRVVPLRGGYLGVWRPIVRTLLLSLAVPALIWDRDQRGLHDKAAGTILVRI